MQSRHLGLDKSVMFGTAPSTEPSKGGRDGKSLLVTPKIHPPSTKDNVAAAKNKTWLAATKQVHIFLRYPYQMESAIHVSVLLRKAYQLVTSRIVIAHMIARHVASVHSP